MKGSLSPLIRFTLIFTTKPDFLYLIEDNYCKSQILSIYETIVYHRLSRASKLNVLHNERNNKTVPSSALKSAISSFGLIISTYLVSYVVYSIRKVDVLHSGSGNQSIARGVARTPMMHRLYNLRECFAHAQLQHNVALLYSPTQRAQE